MRSRQQGVTFIGWLFLLAPLGLVVYCVIRLTPIYLNYMAVAKAVEQVAIDNSGEGSMSPAQARLGLQRRFDVEGILKPEVNDVDVYREGEDWVVEADYTDGVALFAGLSLQVHFNKRAVVK